MKKTILFVYAMMCSVCVVHADQKPNVLFIAVDDLKPLLGSFGDSFAVSPNIDRLSSMGTTFLNAHCQQAVCGPTRASLLTGRRPDQIKVWDLKTKIRKVNPGIVTLPEYFKEQGYDTAALGKVYDPRNVDGRAEHDAQSWTIPYQPTWKLTYNQEAGAPVTAYHGARIKELGAEAKEQGIAGYDELTSYLIDHDAWPAFESEDLPDNAYEDGAMTDRAIELLSELSSGDQPFFLAVGFKKPHLPFVAPKKYWDLYDRSAIALAPFQEHAEGSPDMAYHNFEELRSYSGIPQSGPVPPEQQRELIHGYYACVSYIDAQVGRLLDELQRLGIADKTVIILWGDHGWHLGDHGLWAKHTNYEQATRAPLIIVAPDGRGGVKTSTPVEFVDIFPTLCELTGLELPADLAGLSVVPLMNGTAESIKPFAVSQFPRGKNMGYALRNDRYRFVAWIPKKGDNDIARSTDDAVATELFDYEKDPEERVNLVDDPEYVEIASQLSSQLSDFLSNQ